MGLNINLNEQLKKVLEHNARNEVKCPRFMGDMIYWKEDEQDKRREVNEQPEQHSQDKKTEESNNSDQ